MEVHVINAFILFAISEQKIQSQLLQCHNHFFQLELQEPLSGYHNSLAGCSHHQGPLCDSPHPPSAKSLRAGQLQQSRQPPLSTNLQSLDSIFFNASSTNLMHPFLCRPFGRPPKLFKIRELVMMERPSWSAFRHELWRYVGNTLSFSDACLLSGACHIIAPASRCHGWEALPPLSVKHAVL